MVVHSQKMMFCSLFLFIMLTSKHWVLTAGYSTENIETACDQNQCKSPGCACFGAEIPKGYKLDEVPQFVMLTFDDAMTVANANTYREILQKRKNKVNGCRIAMTFFVCHEYNDYEITNEMYSLGNEIAVHSITHETNTDIWKKSNASRWRDEMVGMRKILSKFSRIPEESIKGHRAPFLQTAGDSTFRVLRDSNFLYDSSMPTRKFVKPPLWPYTMDFGYPQDCQIQPCPKESLPGFWILPMVQYDRKYKKGKKTFSFRCSMADACTPYPETAKDTKEYLMQNFQRHYSTNKAPFPVFLHEAWLRDENRLIGYLDFLDEILDKDDVFVVTVQEVLDYMKNPITFKEYAKKRPCYVENRHKSSACEDAVNCYFKERERFVKSCVTCPIKYPWLGNPLGL